MNTFLPRRMNCILMVMARTLMNLCPLHESGVLYRRRSLPSIQGFSLRKKPHLNKPESRRSLLMLPWEVRRGRLMMTTPRMYRACSVGIDMKREDCHLGQSLTPTHAHGVKKDGDLACRRQERLPMVGTRERAVRKQKLAIDDADLLGVLKSANVALIPQDLEPCCHRQFRDLIVCALDHLDPGNSSDPVKPMSHVNLATKTGPNRSPSRPRFAA